MLGHHSRLFGVAGLLLAMQFGAGLAAAATPDSYDPWPGLVQDIFKNRAMNDGAGVVAIEMGATARDLAMCIHPHPTLTETIMEAAESLHGLATHLYKVRRSETAKK